MALSQDSGHFLIQHKEWGFPLGAFTTILDKDLQEVKAVVGFLTAPDEYMIPVIIEAHVQTTIREMYGNETPFTVKTYTECNPSVSYKPSGSEPEKVTYTLTAICPKEYNLMDTETGVGRWQHFLLKRTKGTFQQEIGIISNCYEEMTPEGPYLTSYLNLNRDVLVGNDQLPILSKEIHNYTSERFVNTGLCNHKPEFKGRILVQRGPANMRDKLPFLFSCESDEKTAVYSMISM